MMQKGFKRVFVTILVLTTTLLACEKQDKKTDKTEQTAVPVTVIPATLELVNVQYKSIGTLVAREAPVIRARISGQIEQLLVHEGEEVHKDQPLLKMKQEELALALQQAEAKLIQAKAQLNESDQDAARADKLIGKGYISQEQYSQIQAQRQTAQANVTVAMADLAHAQFQAAQVNVLSPINGHVGKIAVSVGEYVSGGTPLLNIVNHDQLRAELPFSEQKTPLLVKGQKVLLTSPTTPGKVVTSIITSITPDINPDNRAVNALVVFANQYDWKPGSSVQGIVSGPTLKTIMVPEACLVMQSTGKIIHIVQNNKAVARNVETGYQTEGWIAITKGLQPGDQVVVAGTHYLSDGTPVIVQKQPANKL